MIAAVSCRLGTISQRYSGKFSFSDIKCLPVRKQLQQRMQKDRSKNVYDITLILDYLDQSNINRDMAETLNRKSHLEANSKSNSENPFSSVCGEKTLHTQSKASINLIDMEYVLNL